MAEDIWAVVACVGSMGERSGRLCRCLEEPQVRSASRGRGVDRSRQDSAPQRSYYFDAEGQIASELAAALQDAEGCTCTEAVPQMRFLHYARAGGYLPPHTDLSRQDVLQNCDCTLGSHCCDMFRRDWRSGQRTSHTFILYLEGATEEGGGQTVLLEGLSGPELAQVRGLSKAHGCEPSAVATSKVSPVRGRLLVFPHECAHKATSCGAKAFPFALFVLKCEGNAGGEAKALAAWRDAMKRCT